MITEPFFCATGRRHIGGQIYFGALCISPDDVKTSYFYTVNKMHWNLIREGRNTLTLMTSLICNSSCHEPFNARLYGETLSQVAIRLPELPQTSQLFRNLLTTLGESFG